MKITKNTLKRMIKEELDRVLRETWTPPDIEALNKQGYDYDRKDDYVLACEFRMSVYGYNSRDGNTPTQIQPAELIFMFDEWPRHTSGQLGIPLKGSIGVDNRGKKGPSPTEAEEALRKAFQEVIANFPGTSKKVDMDSGTFSKLAPLILAAINPGDPNGAIDGTQYGEADEFTDRALTLQDVLNGYKTNRIYFTLSRGSSTSIDGDGFGDWERDAEWKFQSPRESGSNPNRRQGLKLRKKK